jgi:CheY-like chemotaxis protein
MTLPAATILIVDDNVHNRKLFSALLHSQGYLFRTAANGPLALESVAECPPDLILLDYMMPGMDGCEVARKLKENPLTKAIPIIMLSAMDDIELLQKSNDAGIQDFLTKPFSRIDLSEKIRKLLES